MAIKGKRNSLILYGALMGILLVLLQAISYRTMIRDITLEIYGVIIAVFFLALGLWFGSRGIRKKNQKNLSKKNPQEFGLSNREVDVLLLMVEGLTNQEIADRLYVSLNTVKTHSSNIYLKLQVERRTQAIRKARELGLV